MSNIVVKIESEGYTFSEITIRSALEDFIGRDHNITVRESPASSLIKEIESLKAEIKKLKDEVYIRTAYMRGLHHER